MFFLFVVFICMKVCNSEWPPIFCEPQVSIKNNVVTLTSEEKHEREYSCKLQEKFNNQVFIQFEKKYSNRIFKKSHDSIIGITITNEDKHLFNLRIHNDRVNSDSTERKCFGIFTSKKFWLRIKLHSLYELKKTFISVDTAINDVYTSCLKFEIDDVVDVFSIQIHAITDTGMVQMIHNVADKQEPKNNLHLEKELHVIKDRIRVVENFMENAVRKLTENRVLVHQKHDEINRRLTHSQNVHEQKVTTHSVVLLFCVSIIGVLIVFCMKFDRYNRWSREHIL